MSAVSSFSGETASYYARFRRPYPIELVDRLAGRFGGRRARLLDLGCGTGQLLIPLAGAFGEAVGIDPEPDMLREAVGLADSSGVANARWRLGEAADLPALTDELGRFELVTIGTAFHWMDARPTLESLQRLLRGGGGVAVAYNGSPIWLHDDSWARIVREVLEARFGRLTDSRPDDSLDSCVATMEQLGYASIEHWEQVYESEVDFDWVIGHLYSALSSEQLQAAERPAFEAELRRELGAVAPSGRVTESVRARAVIGTVNGKTSAA